MPTHRTFRANPPKPGIDLAAAFEAAPPKIASAARAASEALTKAGIRHALCGGLAVGAHGYPRNTKDVDFLVGPEAFIKHGSFITFHPSFPISIEGVAVDAVLPEAHEKFLVMALARSEESEGLAVVPIEVLLYLKVIAGRARDKGDFIGLVKAGAPTEPAGEALAQHSPEHLPRFASWLVAASTEDD
jgi:hypothetical protein